MSTGPAAAPPSDPLGPVFDAAGAEWNVDPSLLRAVAGQESGATANPDLALSPKGAQGRMQLMPATAAAMGVTNTSDPVQSIYGGAKYLAQQLDRYGSPELALAAYNAGPGRLDGYTDKTTGQHVPGWLQTIGDPRTGAITPQQFASQIPIAETAAYVPGIARRYQALTASNSNVPAAPAPDPNASPAAAPIAGTSQPPPTPRAGGDSLAVGLAQYNGFGGGGVTGANPTTVLANLQTEPQNSTGAPYWLSSGISNAGDKMGSLPIVQKQIDLLRSKGYSDIRLVGTGARADLAPLNGPLADLATTNGVSFTGPIPSGGDQVHPGTPAGYRALAGMAQPATAPQDGGATARLQQALGSLRQPAAASPAPSASPVVQAAYDPFSQAVTAAQSATAAAPGAAAPAAPQTPFDQAMAAAQAATRSPAAAPLTPGSPATPASTAPVPAGGAATPGGAPAASDPFSQALAAAQRVSTTSPAPTAPGSPPAPAQSAAPPAAAPGQPQAGTGLLGNVLNTVPAIGHAFDAASHKLYDAIDYGNRVGPAALAPDGSPIDRLINPVAAAANLDPRMQAYDRSGIGSTPGGVVGDIIGQTAITAPALGALGGPLAAIGGRLAAGADALAPELGAALRYGGRLVSGTASSENKLLNAVVRPVSLAANGAAQGAAVNTVMGDPSASPYQNALTGAAVGAVLGPAAAGVMKGVGAGYNALTGLIRPFTAAGQGAIADQALARLAVGGPLTPDAAAYVPGSTPTLAQATNNAGLAGAERAVAAVRSQPFATQAAVNSDMRDAQLATLTGTPTDIAAAKAARNATALPSILDPIANATGPANAQAAVDAIDSALASPAGQRDAVTSALGDIRSKLVSPAAPFPSRVSDALAPITDAIANGGTGDAGLWAARDALVAAQKGGAQEASTLARLQGTTSPDPAYQTLIDQAKARIGATNTVESDPGQLYGIRGAIRDKLAALASDSSSDAQLASSKLLQARTALDNSIEAVAPGFKSGLAEYADASQPIAAMRYLQSKNYTAADGTITMAKMKGVLDDIAKQQALPGPRDAKNITPDTLTSLQGLYADLVRQNNSRTGMSVGSNTFQNLATASTLGNFGVPLAFTARTVGKIPVVGNMLTNGFTKLYEGQNEPVMNAVVNRLLNPTAGASVLEAAGKLQARQSAGPAGVYPAVTSLGVALRNRLIGSQ